MCDCVEMTIKLKKDADTEALFLPTPSAHRLPKDEVALFCSGEFPNYFITNGSCGCGAVEGSEGGPARLVPIQFVGGFLSVFPVRSVELLWWWGSDLDKPSEPPRQIVQWPEFLHLNELQQLRSRVLYEVIGKPER